MNQKFITDYYPVIRRRGGFHCYRCKRKFISKHHRALHIRGDKNCPWNPQEKTKYTLELLDEEILLHIASYLSFDYSNSLVCMIHALPRLLFVHGMKILWTCFLILYKSVSFFNCLSIYLCYESYSTFFWMVILKD